MFWESEIVAVVLCRRFEDKAKIERLLGTAFLIDNVGHFLTAKHVLDHARQAREAVEGSMVDLIVRLDNDPAGPKSLKKIRTTDNAPEPNGFAVGKIDHP